MRVSRFTAEFKAEAIKQVIDRGLSVVDVSKRLVYQTKAGIYGYFKPKNPRELSAVILLHENSR